MPPVWDPPAKTCIRVYTYTIIGRENGYGIVATKILWALKAKYGGKDFEEIYKFLSNTRLTEFACQRLPRRVLMPC